MTKKIEMYDKYIHCIDLTCKRGSVGQSEGLSIPRSSVRFRLKPDTSNFHEFELHRPSNKGTKLLLKVIKAIIIIRKAKPSQGQECLDDSCQPVSRQLLHATAQTNGHQQRLLHDWHATCTSEYPLRACPRLR